MEYIIGKQFGGYVLVSNVKDNQEIIDNLTDIKKYEASNNDDIQKLLDIVSSKNEPLVQEMNEKAQSENQILVTKQARIAELQDKAILEGLTDAEKEEYKKLTSN